MKNPWILLPFTLILFGCAYGTISQTGDKCTATYSSLFKSVDTAKVGACGAKSEVTNAQTELSEALTELLLKGLTAE